MKRDHRPIILQSALRYLSLLFLIVWSVRAEACIPFKIFEYGYVYSDYSPPLQEDGQITIHLPENAKGVLIYIPFGSGEVNERSVTIHNIDTKLHLKAVYEKLDVKSFGRGSVFRVGPRNGFVNGQSYLFTYDGLPGFPTRTLKVYADTPIPVPAAKEFGIELNGIVQKKPISAPMDGACDESLDALVQFVHYKIPARYQQYANLLSFFTYKTPFIGNKVDSTSSPFSLYTYIPSLAASNVPFGGSHVGRGNDLLYLLCRDVKSQEELQQYIKGYVGFLELDDTLHEVGPIEVSFKDAIKACSQ